QAWGSMHSSTSVSSQMALRGRSSWGVRSRGARALRGLLAFALSAIVLGGCSAADHHLNYPREAAPSVITWSDDFERDQLRMHIEGARPPGPGPFPTVIVFPEEEETALDMRGAIWDLASRGYVAIAADYLRLIDGKYRRNMFAWRSSPDLTFVIDVTSKYPEVDQNRIGTVGF